MKLVKLTLILVLVFVTANFWKGKPTSLNYSLTSFGAVCDGSTDDASAFITAGDTIRANPLSQTIPVTLSLPSGQTCIFASCGTDYAVFHDILDFTLNLNSGTVKSEAGGCLQWNNAGINGASGNTDYALFQTASIGASCVTVVTAGQESRFTVGRWVIAGGLGLQKNSFPPNLGIFEFLQVASVNTGTHEVCFTSNLVNAYKSTWPDYGISTLECSNAPCGGPATLYLLAAGWGGTYTVKDGTWNYYNQTYFSGRIVNFTNVTDLGVDQGCVTPTQSQTITFTNYTATNCNVEEDKEIDNLIYDNSTVKRFIVQSSSIHTITIRNSSSITDGNTPENFVCLDSTIGTLKLGPSGFGRTKSFVGNNCNFTHLQFVGLLGGNYLVNQGGWSVSSGVFTNSNANGPPQWAIDDGDYYFIGQYDYESFPFTVTDLAQAGNNFTVTTTLPAGLPTLPENAGNLGVSAAVGVWSCVNCSGSPTAIDLSQAGAQDALTFTYSSRTYTCTNNIVNVPNSLDLNNPPIDDQRPNIWGVIGTVTINVSTADTGANPTLVLHAVGQYDNFPTIAADTTVGTFGPQINLKTAGTRTITDSGTTGEQTGDTISSPGAVSFTGYNSPYLGTDISGQAAGTCPVVTITWQTTRGP